MSLMQIFNGSSQDWGDIPAQLGMTISDKGLLVGKWNNHVELRGLHTYRMVRSNTSDHHEEKHYYTELYALLDPPLLMGLRINEQGALGRAARKLFGTEDIEVGYPAFDERFLVKGVDADHVRRLVNGPVGVELLRAAGVHPSLWISDIYATTEYSGYERDLGKVRVALEAVGRIGEALLAQRARELAPWEPPLRAAWQNVASGWRLTFDPQRARMSGEAHGLPITVGINFENGRFVTSARFTLPRPPACEISLAPQESDGFFSRLFRGQDIKVGDPAFDSAFIVKGEPEEVVRSVLTPIARQRLLAIRSRAGVHLEKGALYL
ncbi:MAG: hypothetical protein ABI193_13010, partial [Minicystis sp.]